MKPLSYVFLLENIYYSVNGIHTAIYVSVKIIIFQDIFVLIICFAFWGEFVKHHHALLGKNLQKLIFTHLFVLSFRH